MVIGPFEYRNNIVLLALTDSSVFIITLDFWAFIKYSISLQVPFIFDNSIDKLKNKPLGSLLDKFESLKIDYLDDLQIEIVKSQLWKNHLIVHHNGNITKLGILDRGRTDEYERILKERIKIIQSSFKDLSQKHQLNE